MYTSTEKLFNNCSVVCLLLRATRTLLTDYTPTMDNITEVNQFTESEPIASINATGRVFAALSLILFYFKIFRFYSISQVLGPRVLMVAKMV